VLFPLYNCTVIEENNMSNRLNFYDNIVSVGGMGYLYVPFLFTKWGAFSQCPPSFLDSAL
jgi:hypothetical protein